MTPRRRHRPRRTLEGRTATLNLTINVFLNFPDELRTCKHFCLFLGASRRQAVILRPTCKHLYGSLLHVHLLRDDSVPWHRRPGSGFDGTERAGTRSDGRKQGRNSADGCSEEPGVTRRYSCRSEHLKHNASGRTVIDWVIYLHPTPPGPAENLARSLFYMQSLGILHSFQCDIIFFCFAAFI